FHTAPGAAQATLAAFFTGLAVGQVFHGPASDRWGRRGPMLAGVAVFVAASVWCALATSLPILIAARFLQALGGCAGPVIARAVVRDHFGHRQSARVLSRLFLVMGIAPIVAPLAGGALLGLGGWRALFWVLTAFGSVMAVWTTLGLAESRSAATAEHARGEHPIAGYLALLKSPTLVGYLLAGAFNSGALFAYVSASPNLLIETYGIAPKDFGWVFGVNSTAIIAASGANAHFLRRASPETILLWARPAGLAFAAALALVAFTGWGGMIGLMAPLFLVVGSFGFMGANTQAAAMSVDPLRAGSISALMGAASFAAGAATSALTAALTAHWPHAGAKPMATAMLVAILVSTGALYGLARPGRAKVRTSG
ncbi:MAG: multidrug effflux MFS transporter, partial [Caulobacteraceae bacterium]|nr:multidrug effflux MFS transporter [Caulobacteraceae bacterium]